MNPPNQSTNSSQYISMVNYLIDNLNKSKSATIHHSLHNKPIFLMEFFVFDLFVPAEIIRKIKQPILAFRFLDFPTLTLHGTVVHPKKLIQFNQGKSSYFEMELGELKEALTTNPMYIMLIDMNYGDMSIIASSRLNVSIFAYDSFIQYENGNIPKPRRNILKLFDNVMEKISEFEMTLLIRREYYKYENNAFPYNEKKIIIQERTNGKMNKNSTYARPFSNDLRMKSTDTVIQSQQMQLNKNLQEQEMPMLSSNVKDVKNASVNTQGLSDNVENIQQHSPYADDYWRKNQQQKQMDSLYENEIYDLKQLLNSNDKNPPPLFFHNNKNKQIESQEKVIKIIDEEHKIDNNNKNQSISIQGNNSLAQSSSLKKSSNQQASKKFYMNKKKNDKEVLNDMYRKSTDRYNDYMKNNGGIIKPASASHQKQNKNRLSKKKYPNTKNSSSNQVKIEEYENESDDEYNNISSDNQNEYLKIFGQIKSSVREEKPGKIPIKKSNSLRTETEENNNNDRSKNKENKSTKKQQDNNNDISENIKDDSSYGKFYDFTNSNVISSNNNIIKSLQKSNDINLFIEANHESSIFASGKQQPNLVNSANENHINSQNKSSIDTNIIQSMLESDNKKKKGQISAIRESIEGYNDFDHSYEDKRESDNRTNKSQIITEENIVKKSKTNKNESNSISIEESLAQKNKTINQSSIQEGNYIRQQNKIIESNDRDSIRESLPFSDRKQKNCFINLSQSNNNHNVNSTSKMNDSNEIEEMLND